MADDLSEQVSSKAVHGGEGGDGGVIRIKDAIKTLKTEILEMNKTIGMSSAELLRHQRDRISRRIRHEHKKKKARLMLRGVKALSASFGGEESDSSA